MKFMRLSDLKAGSGEKQTLLLPVTSPYPVEMTVICGCRPGKTLVVTAGVHGCEYVGIETLNQLKKELNPAALSGRVILLPLVNPEGFYHGSKQTIPADGQNLNRMFPGKSDGTFSKPALPECWKKPVTPKRIFLMGPARRTMSTKHWTPRFTFLLQLRKRSCFRRSFAAGRGKPLLRSLPGYIHLQKRTLQLGRPVRDPRPFSRARRNAACGSGRRVFFFCIAGKMCMS